MKFALVSAIFLGLAAFVYAEDDIHWFSEPLENTDFTTTDKIHFVTNGITNDADETIIVRLFNAEDDSFIKQIGSYTGESISRDDDKMDWNFDWVVDVPQGSYYVRLYEQDADGQIDDDDEWDNAIRSYSFNIRAAEKRKRATLKRSQLMKKRAQALQIA